MTPVFRGRSPAPESRDPIRMVLDDGTVERLQEAAVRYGIEVEELIVALLQQAATRIEDLIGPPARDN